MLILDKINFSFEQVKIICVGRNYADHAKELGNEVPQEPVLVYEAGFGCNAASR